MEMATGLGLAAIIDAVFRFNHTTKRSASPETVVYPRVLRCAAVMKIEKQTTAPNESVQAQPPKHKSTSTES
jgi:hypothetical protein